LLNPVNGVGSIEHGLLASARQASQLPRPWEGGSRVFDNPLGHYSTLRFRESRDVLQEHQITQNGDPRHPDVALRKAVGGDTRHHGYDALPPS